MLYLLLKKSRIFNCETKTTCRRTAGKQLIKVNDMRPFNIKKENETLEIVAKITDSMVQDYGCRVRYNRADGQIDLVGDDYCHDVVTEVVSELITS